MPRIFDNIDQHLLPALRTTLTQGARSLHIAVGYFNLRGWDGLGDLVDTFSGADDSCCQLIVGMQRAPDELMRQRQRLRHEEYLDGPTIARHRYRAAQTFKEQIEFGVPTRVAERTLRLLAQQLRARKLRVKLFLQHQLHAKLYLVQRSDPIAPLVGYLGSSNLTFSGLEGQGELNVDVVEHDAARKLHHWFQARWNDPLAFDISDDLATLIETSWAAERLVKPYHVYLKMAYHLCQEAREGERAFTMPAMFRDVLLDFQAQAVSLAAHHLHRRSGVLLGDVVGLGKTLMATAIARLFQEDDTSNTLVICPPKLVAMWRWHLAQYHITGTVLSLGQVIRDLPHLPRHRLVIVDESHNLRNREGGRYAAIRDYIARNEARVLLLTATPYNKQFSDLSNQLRLFLDEGRDLHVRPEQFFQEWAARGLNEADFGARFQALPRSLRAFEQSQHADDWRDLLRLFMVRRTRQFIIRNYATFDEERERFYVTLNEQRAYFPLRLPRTVPFALDEANAADQYARLYRDRVVQVLETLSLPRYELAAYVNARTAGRATPDERTQLDNLARAGRRLLGFSRTNLFKRLESSGRSFLLSLHRHILRNMVTLHALDNGLPLPIGTQDAALLDTSMTDADAEFDALPADDTSLGAGEGDVVSTDDEAEGALDATTPAPHVSLAEYQTRAAAVYHRYAFEFRRRFRWLNPTFFRADLKRALRADAEALIGVLQAAGRWEAAQDTKLHALHQLVAETHPNDKLLVFTQFADTARYLHAELEARHVTHIAVATGHSDDPTALARRFSPHSNGGLRMGESELRVLIATDVLGEGQNLQDAHVVVNYDLPWAIIRLIQRAGRVDRIGQQHDTILAYSFMPAEGVERIIRLRARLAERLAVNGEVVGTDETFFGEEAARGLRDLYTERGTLLDDDSAEDVDLASVALQVWNSASDADKRVAQSLPPVVGAARAVGAPDGQPSTPGVISYLRFPDGTDALVRVDEQGQLVSQSIAAVFRAAACGSDTPALPKTAQHHELVAAALAAAAQEQDTFAGQLGSLRSTRRQVYEVLKRCREAHQRRPTLFSAPLLERLPAVQDTLLRFPLREQARTTLTRQLRLGITDEGLAELVIRLYDEDRLAHVVVAEDSTPPEPQIVCSLGLLPANDDKITRWGNPNIGGL